MQAGQQGVQLWLLVAAIRIGLFLDDLLAPCFGQRLALCDVVNLVAAVRAEVADQHGGAPSNTAGLRSALQRQTAG